MTRRAVQLVVSCVVLGAGIVLLLDAGLGSDGYSTMVNGIHLATGQPFWLMNLAVSVVFIALAALRSVRPGVGTVVQMVVVGVTVSVLMPFAPDPSSYALRVAELALAFPVLAIGVAGYLASKLGAGPAEAAALAWDPPLRFMWSYSVMQVCAALLGWWLGAAVGIGTLPGGAAHRTPRRPRSRGTSSTPRRRPRSRLGSLTRQSGDGPPRRIDR